ncbi:hypothetical protein ENUP19_0216G0036 [Entamoeba nuttalli]|uniref:DNA-directed RNA polymerase subunit n=2 Tax=Entamoeba nuttalli TaxID=412467 RepID=K2HUI7_ENTNP|nr:DNA-directed RNA polymerase II large subunit, putative [Entamoeba nuttalli P19]EKE39890.1 DNA-directed RNA polymerase II large subunit, putative [Entamoeba nuttalli P19]|eukprot:XP_008857772.1 DNA-directed RNA polymerase II large subunit, putative [Entamoeba nuttalli P19]
MTELNMETKRVKQIKFTLLSSEQIRKMGVCKITESTSVSSDGKPVLGGLADPRMGPFEKGEECQTCRGTRTECPGHFGYIELTQPVYNAIYMKYILHVLKCVCPICKRIYCHGDERVKNIKSTGEERLKEIYEFIHKNYKACGVLSEKKKDLDKHQNNEEEEQNPCNGPIVDYELPKLKSENKLEIRRKNGIKTNEENDFKPRDALAIFKDMTDEDVRVLGFDPIDCHPKFMIFTLIPVPPPCVRPSIVSEGAKESKDDLTVLYENVITANERLKEENQKCEGVSEYYNKLMELQTICAKISMKNVKLPETMLRKKNFKSIEERLSSKQGRLRLNLMGKRVDFSARTVISPDPNLSMDEVGVPTGVAKILTFPEVVTQHNKEKLQKLVNAGMNDYPGAFMLERKNGQTYRLNGSEKIIDIGDTVHRYIMNGDYVIFNRQPSLHRMSMMGHKVRVLPFSTFRMNLCDTTPYNADFDGDEMNLHVPQTLEARAEVATLMLTPTQIITPQDNGPIMGIVQDTQCGSYLITKRETFIEQLVFYNILQCLDNFDGTVPIPAILKPIPKWTGKQVFTQILPTINFHRGNWSIKELLKRGPAVADSDVYILDGVHLVGSLRNKSEFGKNRSGIIQTIFKDKGMEATKVFFNKTQATVNSWILTRGFTVGVGDIVVPQSVHDSIRANVEKSKKEAVKFLSHQHDDEIKVQAGNTMFENLESELGSLLEKLKNECDSITTKSLKKDNNLLAMVDSGSKGSTTNILQMVAFVGKQEINNLRIPFGFYKRTLPHYWKEDYGFVSRGFVENSYVMGLSPQEFFFHAMAGRQGIIDTAVKTSDTGYIQRKMVKCMEDVQCKYDRTVRRSSGDMVEFMYGGDGVDALMCETQKYIYCNDSKPDNFEGSINEYDTLKMNELYKWDLNDEKLSELLDEDIYNKLFSDEYQTLFDNEFQRILDERAELYQPWRRSLDLKPCDIHIVVNFARQIDNVIAARYLPKSQRSNLDPKYVIERENALIKELSSIGAVKNDKFDEERFKDALGSFGKLLHCTLSSKQCLIQHHLSKESFDDLMDRIKNIYERSFINPGEMVGSIAAQSIGAPATQMTLNTFHHAGISSASVTEGVPRLKELLNVSKTPKTPSMNVYLTNDTRESMVDLDKELNKTIPYTKLKDLIDNVEIWFDPDIANSVIEEDREFINDFIEVEEIKPEDYCKWTIRLVFGYNKMVSMGVDSDSDILRVKIKELFKDALVIPSDSNNIVNGTVKIVVHIRFRVGSISECSNIDHLTDEVDKSVEAVAYYKSKLDELLRTVVISGIEGITKVIIPQKPKNTIVVDPETKMLRDQLQWVVFTEGSNMAGLAECDNVDFYKTVTNNVYETFLYLGIEAGRTQLEAELIKTLSGSYVNFRHLALMADVMTFTGRIQPFNRMGLSRGRAGVITRASFEQTLEQFRRAAAFSESDILNGISQNILMGQRTVAGTGAFTVLLDIDSLKASNIDENSFSEEEADKKAFIDGFDVSPIRTHLVMSPTNTNKPKPMGFSPSPVSPRKTHPQFATPSPFITSSSPRSSPMLMQFTPRFSSGPSPYNPATGALSKPAFLSSPMFAGKQSSPYNNPNPSPFLGSTPAFQGISSPFINYSSPSIFPKPQDK